jgi:hypothetical protein
MNVLPASQQHRLLLSHDPHRLPNFGPRLFGPDQFGGIAGTNQIDLGVAIAKHMDMSRHMIVHKNDHTQAVGSEYGGYLVK